MKKTIMEKIALLTLAIAVVLCGSPIGASADTYRFVNKDGTFPCFIDDSDILQCSFDASDITTGTLPDARLSANVTTQGNTFNGNDQLVQLNSSGELPAIDGSNLTGIIATDIADGIVTTLKIGDGAVTSGKIDANAILTVNLQDGAVTTPKIGSGAVNSEKVLNDSLTADDLAPDSVGSSEIAANAVDTDEINTGAVTTPKLGSDAVTTAKIINGAVTTPKLGSGAVNSEKVLDNSLTDDDLAMNSVGTSEIQTGAVTTAQLGADSVTTLKVINGAITTPKLASGAVSESKLLDNAVTTNKIADGSVSEAKLDFNPATQPELNSHTATEDAHFDHADDLTELNTQIGSGLVTGAHTSSLGAAAITVGTFPTGTWSFGTGTTMTIGSYTFKPLATDAAICAQTCAGHATARCFVGSSDTDDTYISVGTSAGEMIGLISGLGPCD